METSSKTDVAVVGCGYWGKNLVRNFEQLGALRLVCDASPQGLERAKELAPEAKRAENLEEVLSSDIGAVVVATPAETHHATVKKLLLAGKDVLVEKPLALNYHEGAELVRIAREKRRILMVGHVLEYHPGVQKLIEIVKAGELGKLRYVCSNRLSLGKVRREENILWSFAPHDIAVILRLMGGSMPFQISACGAAYVQPNIADVTVTHLLFDNGIRAHIYVSWLHPFKEQKLVVVGSKAMASFDDVAKELIVYDHNVEIRDEQPVPIKGEGRVIPFPSDEPLKQECRAFLEAVATRTPPITDDVSGLNVLRVLQAAQCSLISNGVPVALPLADLRLNSYASSND